MTYTEILTARHRTCDGDLVRAEQTDERQVTRRYMGQESLARVVSPEPTQTRLPDQRAA
jgi:hypothetical protein